MAGFIEPLIIQGINRDVAPGALDYSGRKVLNPVRDVLNARYLTSEGGQSGKVEHIKGMLSLESASSIFQEVTTNSEFVDTLDPWLQLEDGDFALTHDSDTALMSGDESAGSYRSHTFYQLNEVGVPKAGELAKFTINASKSAGVLVLNLTGLFLDADLNIIQTFSIGSLGTITSQKSSTTQKIVPEGTRHFGVYMTAFTLGGAFTARFTQVKIEATILQSFPEGQNECIGSYENVEKNALFFMLWNSNGYHGVYKLDGHDFSITQLIADDPDNPVLDFDRNSLITGIGMIGDILTWTDNRKPQRYFNVTRKYPTLNDQLISLAKIGPKNPPTFSTRANDTSISFNRITGDSYQFAYQYVYKDNEVSVLSPYSKLSTGDIDPQMGSTDRAKLQVSHTVDSEVSTLIKEVRLLYRKNNEPNWYVWKQVRNFGSTISEYFFNNEQGTVIPASESTKLFDLVPNRSRALTIFRGRVFLNINEEGFPDTISSTLSASLATAVNHTTDDLTAVNTQGRGAFLKKNGNYLAGIFYRDKLGRLSGITSKVAISMEELDIASTYNINANPTSLDAANRAGYKLNITVAGLGPPSCEYFIALTREQNYQEYMQVPAHILWYLGNTTLSLSGDVVKNGDRAYRKNAPSSGNYQYLHFLLPKNIPFVPDQDCYVRFVSQNITVVERVVEVVDGDILVTENFNNTTWNSQPNGIKGVPFIEVFKPNSAIEPFFYQAVGPYTTDANGVHQTTSIQNIEGDTFMIHVKTFNFRYYKLDSFQQINSQDRKSSVSPALFVESPSPITKTHQVSTIQNIEGGALQVLTAFAKPSEQSNQPDYSKIASSRGWPIVEAKPQLLYRPATIRYSDVYIEGSEINGLNSFPVDNSYDKIGQDRSPITKLIAVGNNLLAVHERHVTTIYIGEGIVKAGDTGFITKVENVVGDDRKLNGEWGSYHPESVQEIDGQVFGYDIYSGVVWRYTVEGLVSISDFGLENHFKQRSEKYFPYRDQLRFVSAIDRYHKEYLITLPHLYLTKEAVARQSASSGSKTYDFVLNPAQYEVGKTYRLKVVPYNQSSSDNHNINVSAYFNGDSGQSLLSNLVYRVDTTSEDEADAIYIEFKYNGQGYIRLSFTSISIAIYINISSEYQELTGETWAFNYRARQWSHRYGFVPDYMGKLGTGVIAFKNGRVYKHAATDTYNNFFGEQQQSRLEIEANPAPGKDKVWAAIHLDREVLAVDQSLKVVEVSNDHGQESYTRAKEFDTFNGIHMGPILKDINTNPALIPGKIPLRDGKDMRSKTLNIVVNCDSTGPARLQKLNVLGQFSEFST